MVFSAKEVNLTRTILNYLYPASLIYLSLPLLIFFAGFLRWYVALIPLIFLITSLICFLIKNTPDDGLHSDIKLYQVIILFVVAFALMLFSGAGCFGLQAGDWCKHNAILTDLIHYSWPLYYKFDDANVNIPIVYYIAYYLPAALVGKMISYGYGHKFLFLWTYMGYCIALLWFVILVKRSAMLVIIVFLGFSGLDCLGHITVKLIHHQPIGNIFQWGLIEWWAGYWQYSSNISLLFYVPNQALSGWIVTGLVMYEFLYSNFKKNIILYIALISLWSPFVVVGLAPFFLADLVVSKKQFVKSLANYFTITNICGFLCLFIIALYYFSKMGYEGTNDEFIFFYPLVIDDKKFIIYTHLMLFIVLEFGLYAVLIRMSGLKMNDKEKKIFWTAIFTLLALPLFKYGLFNDFVMRVSIPSLFILCVFLAKALYSRSSKILKTALFVMVLIGSVGPILETQGHILHVYKTKLLWHIHISRNLYMIHDNVKQDFFSQYVGSSDSIFFKYLARKESYTPCVIERKGHSE